MSSPAGEANDESGPRPFSAQHFDCPAAGPDDLADDVEPQPQAACRGRGSSPAVERLEDARQQQLSGLQARLGQLLAVYTPTHPSVLTVQQNIAALSAWMVAHGLIKHPLSPARYGTNRFLP